MKLFTIYYMNVMQELDSEVVASEERPTNKEALAYLIKNELVGEHYSDDIEVYPITITTLEGEEVTVKVVDHE